jgi:hypothetical protein
MALEERDQFQSGKFGAIDPDVPNRHHDAIEFPDGCRVLVAQLLEGQRVTVLHPAKLKLLNYATLAELLIAYVDDAHAASDTRALKILDRRAMLTNSRRNVVRL